MVQASLGRVGKQVWGGGFLLALLFIGFLGNDLFFFYLLYCVFFQQGSEIPARNEVDELDFPRVVAGLAIGVLALLCLIPMQ